MRFKVGDRVRYISDKGAVPKGACGTIRKIEKDDVYHVPYVVRLDNKVRKGYCYYAAERNLEAALEDINETEEKGKMNIEAIQTFATRAKTLRKERGLSQTELAANKMNIKLNPDSVRRAVMQEEARKIAHEAVVDQIDDKARSYDTAIAYVLHTEFGFGEQRIRRFLRAVVDAHVYTRERYGTRYQDGAYYQLLRRDGIDMTKIEDELDEHAKERGAISE